jgi:hypothetical protein
MFTCGPAVFAQTEEIPVIEDQWDADLLVGTATLSTDGNTITSGRDGGVEDDSFWGYGLSSVSRGSGKYYAEILVGGSLGERLIGFGFLEIDVAEEIVDGYEHFFASGVDIVEGDVVGILLDLTAKQMTIRINNVDQMTDAITFATVVHVSANGQLGNPGDYATFTAQFSNPLFTYPLPSGYSAWVDA